MEKKTEASWDDIGSSGGGGGGKDSFLRLGKGSNIVRILTPPFPYKQHKYKPESDKKGYGFRVNCTEDEKTCPVCKKGDKPKKRWLLGVVDKAGMFKILDIGYTVAKAIQTYNRDEAWGNPSNYDIDIVVDPNGGATNYYTVVPRPPKPLSAAALKVKEELDLDVIKRKAAAPSVEKVQERLDKIMSDLENKSNSSDSSDEDEDDDFKDFDSKKAPF
jgi:hypothetical protein